MELTKKQIGITKGIAILFMIFLHLFCRKDITGYYNVFFKINNVPLIYYLALFGDSCVAIYCFCSGYGLLIGYRNDTKIYFRRNLVRLFKLYINYWIILIIFVLGIGAITGRSYEYPGNIKAFLLSFTAISPTYNGAWWFLTTYIILVLVSPFLNKIIIKYNSRLVLGVSLIFYFVSYIQRIKVVLIFHSAILNWGTNQIALFGTSQLPFIVGGIFAQKKIYSKVYCIFNKVKCKNILLNILVLLMIILHSFVETMFIAPFTGIAFICLFNLMDKPVLLNNIFHYLSKHSTNMWLTHMFFYLIFFKKLVFYPKYPVFIFIWIIILCLGTSYIINFMYYPIVRFFDSRLLNISNKLCINEKVRSNT